MKWKLTTGTAIALLLTSTAVFADVTPEDVWQAWQDAAGSMGQKVTADSANRDGDALVVKGISIAFDGDKGGTATFDTVSFVDNGDGTVGIVFPDSYPVTLSVPPSGSDTGPTAVNLTANMPGATITASGTPEAISYKTDAPEIGVTLDSVKPADGSVVDASADVKLTGATGTYLVEGAESGKKITEDFSAKSLDIKIKGADATRASAFDMTASIADFGGKIAVDGISGDMTDLNAALKAGFAFDGSFTHGATSFDINATDAGKPTKIAGSFGSGDLAVTLDANKLHYASGSKTASVTITSPEIPVPDLTLGFGELAFDLLMPVAKSDTPADFAFVTKIIDLKVSDAVWALIDPTGGIPHDPATLIFDTKGTATITKDIMTDAANVEAGNDAPPGLLNSLDLNQLDLKIAGAEVTSNGAFTFDNSDMTTFSGVPAPTGKIDIKAVGVNALIDKLVAMGLLPQDQVMQGRMMMAMFANTSTTSDEITSTLEFKDKHFFANGQQLQ
ncbi:MAG: DUF2125 domain-containing protein [Paracoccaceae bacterium]